MSILRITFTSVRRRYRQIIRAALTTLVAVFFVTAVFIFEENVYQWQMESNKDRFGDWFIMEVGSKNPDSNLTSHIYIEEPVKVIRSVNVLDSEWEKTGFYVGSMPQEFIEKSHIKLDAGRQPENTDEIAMDWNTLLKLGYTGEIGEDINLHYSENNNILSEDKRKTKTYKLVGIYRNYTNIWNNGYEIPSAIVSEAELATFNYDTRCVYIYPIRDSIRTQDYKAIYDSINEKTSRKYIYNSGVYDYKPWGSDNIYLYMYIIVMTIGITALSYQLIEYRNTRRQSYSRYSSLGADSSQLGTMYIIENALIIIPAAVAGVVVALAAGRITGSVLEGKAGFSFYKINNSIIIKAVISVVIAVIVEELVGLISNVKDKVRQKKLRNRSDKYIMPVEVHNGAANNSKMKKSSLKPSNLCRKITARFMKKDGAGIIIGVRLFALCICVVLIFSGMKITTAIKEYKSNDAIPDIYGYLDPVNTNYKTVLTYVTLMENYTNYPNSKSPDVYSRMDRLNDALKSNDRYNIAYDEILNLYTHSNIDKLYTPIAYNLPDCLVMSNFTVSHSLFMKDGNTNLMSGIDKDIIEELKNIPGIVSMEYSIFESERNWYWDNQDYHKMGADKYKKESKSNRPSNAKDPEYGDRYMFATEYITPTRQIYDIASKYIDKSYINYDDFKDGKQIIVFMQDNCDGEYDDTLNAGATVYYNYYNIPFGDCRSNIFDIEESPVYSYDTPFYQKYNNSGKIDLYITPTYAGSSSLTHTLKGTQRDLEIETLFGACVAPKAAAVIKVTDEVKADFNGIIPDYGYYTALASKELANQAIENQKDLMRRITGEELTDGIDFDLQYNQLMINFDLSSTFSATNNKVALYLKSNNITFKSNVDSKNVYRTQLVNNILQYGITILAVIVIQLLIMAIVIRNRVESRSDRFVLFRRMGMTRGKLLGICMREAVRESLWCVFTMPLMLVVELVMCWNSIRRLK